MPSWQDDPVIEEDDKKQPAWKNDPVIEDSRKARQAGARATAKGYLEAAGYGLTKGVTAIPNWLYQKAEEKYGGEKGLFGLGKLEESPLYKEVEEYEPPEDSFGMRATHRVADFAGGSIGPAAAIRGAAKGINALRSGGVWGARGLATMPGSTYAGLEASGSLLGGLSAQGAEEAGFGPTGQAIAGFTGALASPFTVFPAGQRLVQGAGRAYRAAEEGFPDLLAATQARPWYRDEMGIVRTGPSPRDPTPPPPAPLGTAGARLASSPEIREEAIRDLGEWASARGIREADIRHALEIDDWSRVFHPGAETTPGMALMDIPGLAERAGTLRRRYPAARAESDPFLQARRTGVEPLGGLPPTAGLRTYPEGSADLLRIPTGSEPSAGTAMRAEEGMRRMMRVHDSKAHGHAATAEQTIAKYDAELRAESKPFWDAFDRAAPRVNMQREAGLQAWVAKWEAEAAREGIGSSRAAAINKALNEVSTVVDGRRVIFKNPQDVHFGKQVIDDQIEGYLEALPGSTARQVGGQISELKNELVSAIQGVKTANLGSNYTQGAAIHGGGQQTKREVKMGLDLWNKAGDPDTVARIQERFASMTRDEQKRVKLGWTSGYAHELSGRPPGTDPARLVASRERERIMHWLVERSGRPGDVFYKRPERGIAFMRGIGRERATENEVVRGAQTAERAAADQLSSDFEGFKGVLQAAASGQIRNAVMQAGELALARMFGLRAEVAAEQMRILASANPAENRRALAELAMHLGRTRTQIFMSYMRRLAEREAASVTPPLSADYGEAAQ